MIQIGICTCDWYHVIDYNGLCVYSTSVDDNEARQNSALFAKKWYKWALSEAKCFFFNYLYFREETLNRQEYEHYYMHCGALLYS